jgi:hypoxanthine phosphoribosyltransferase|tara:strand:+ start:682 stop:1236 length:555 start_codon:yes stop_codon:yes gene_type:complete
MDIMIKKHYYSWADVEKMCVSIVNQMYKDNWRPDYIVGITRGGNVPATIISNITGIRCEALKVSLRDGESGKTGDSMLWMAEDAFGYNDGTLVTAGPLENKILIVDDINDTGATFNWIMNDWKSGCLPDHLRWNNIFGNNVRFATLTDNLASEFNSKISYTCHEVNKAEEDVWLVYPWENVGEY